MVRRNGFTLIELLVVLAIILLLVGIIAPAMSPVMEMARRQKCAANLKKIVADMRTYAPANEGFFPSAYNDTGPDGVNPPIVSGCNLVGGANNMRKDLSAASPNNVAPSFAGPSRSLYLLVHGKMTTLEAFICPSTDNFAKPVDNTGTAIPDPSKDFDFYSGQQISYSYQAHKNAGSGLYWPPSMTSDASLVMMADRNPIIGDEMASTGSGGWNTSYTGWSVVSGPAGANRHTGLDKYLNNSYNHMSSDGIKGDGQNVVNSDSSARWTSTPNCSSRPWRDSSGSPVGDNIWTWGDAGTGAAQNGLTGFIEHSPTHSGDTFLR